MATVGFIGLGNMGGPMAANLIKAGHTLKVFDLIPQSIDAVLSAGETAQASDSAQDAVQDVDFVFSMLPAGIHVRNLYLGSQSGPGLLASMNHETIVVDCSTIDTASAQAVAQGAAERNIVMLDAPVSGGTGGAQNGTLTFIVGGDTQGLDKVRPLLEVMGANVFHAGAAGAGQTAKICNNMLLSVLMAGTAEALALGVANGLDPSVLSEIMKVSSGGNWALNVYNPYPGVMDAVPSSNDYQGGFLVDLMCKDLGLAMGTAQGTDSSIPMGALAYNLYQAHRSNNRAGGRDFSSIQWMFDPELKSD
ncbi:MAG: 3-hydroxyisobutyrate dehydrogenase [Pseudomonadota bacterium]